MGAERFFATNLLYKSLDSTSFDKAKEEFFEQQLSGYAETPFMERWVWIKNKFCDKISDSNIKEVIASFMDKRLTSTENEYVLSREKCLNYIEIFYFLYQNNDQAFALSNRAKSSLLSLLRDAMTNRQLCEPGRYVRFESIFMEFRSDKNWIDVFLQKQRYLIITELHEAFNINFHISDVMHVHTLALMQRLAHEKNLGITQLHGLLDIYMSSGKEQQIKNYFEKNYKVRFLEYENDVIKNLSEHFLFKLSELLRENQIDISQWDNENVTLPNGHRIELIPNILEFNLNEAEPDTLYLYLQDMPFQGEQIYGVTHYGTPFPIVEPLKNINDTIQTNSVDFENIKQILREKKQYSLRDDLQEQLIISALATRGGQTYLALNNALFNLLGKYLCLSDISEIKAAFFDESENEQLILKSKQECLAQIKKCIEKLLIEQEYFIPLAQVYAIEFDLQSSQLRLDYSLKTIEPISQQLHEAMLSSKLAFNVVLSQVSVSNVILQYPFVLLRHIGNDFSWLANLPDIYKANEFFIKEVIQFFVIKINFLSDKQDAAQMLQNLLEFIGEEVEYLDRLPELPQQHLWIQSQLNQYKHTKHIAKRAIINTLTTVPDISLSQLVQLTQKISPSEFEDVIKQRLNMKLNLFSYHDEITLYSQFCQELLGDNNWTTYINHKQKLIINSPNNQAVKYYIATTSWFIAYMRYRHHHTYFDSLHDIEMHLKQLKLSLHNFFNKVIQFTLSIVVIIGGIISIYNVIKHFKSLGMIAKDCGDTLSKAENDTLIANSVGFCQSLLSLASLDDSENGEETFLKTCVQKEILMHNNSQTSLPTQFITCLDEQGDRNNTELSFLLFCIIWAGARCALAVINNGLQQRPCFPNNDLSFTAEFKRFINRLWGTFSFDMLDFFVDDNLITRCEDGILRLRGLDDPIAHQKAELLKSILSEIKEEQIVPDNDRSIFRSLQKDRAIFYQDKVHHLSYFKVAGKRRTDTFDLLERDEDDTPNIKTTTLAHLTAKPFANFFEPELKQNKEIDINDFLLNRV